MSLAKLKSQEEKLDDRDLLIAINHKVQYIENNLEKLSEKIPIELKDMNSRLEKLNFKILVSSLVQCGLIFLALIAISIFMLSSGDNQITNTSSSRSATENQSTEVAPIRQQTERDLKIKMIPEN